MGEKKKSCALNFFLLFKTRTVKYFGHWKTYRRIRLSETQTSVWKSIPQLTVAQKGGLTSK